MATNGVLRLVLSQKKRQQPEAEKPATASPAVINGAAPQPETAAVAFPFFNDLPPAVLARFKERAAAYQAKRSLWEQKRQSKMAAKQTKLQEKPDKMQLSARFVKDVNVSEGTQVAPGSKFIKTWRFRNEGSVAWPEGTKLLFISTQKGDQMSGPEQVLVPSVQPGAEVDISVELTAPQPQGKYVGFYRLVSPGGKKFGDRVRNLIYVYASSSSEGEDAKTNVVEAPVLAQLAQMGFNDKSLNLRLLAKCGGDVHRVINRLVCRQQKIEKWECKMHKKMEKKF
jgi:hypothetical protein